MKLFGGFLASEESVPRGLIGLDANVAGDVVGLDPNEWPKLVVGLELKVGGDGALTGARNDLATAAALVRLAIVSAKAAARGLLSDRGLPDRGVVGVGEPLPDDAAESGVEARLANVRCPKERWLSCAAPKQGGSDQFRPAPMVPVSNRCPLAITAGSFRGDQQHVPQLTSSDGPGMGRPWPCAFLSFMRRTISWAMASFPSGVGV